MSSVGAAVVGCKLEPWDFGELVRTRGCNERCVIG